MRSRWRNWASDQICAPALIERPRSEEELVAVVRSAVSSGRKVRAVGSGHSFSDCALTDGVMIDTSALQRILDIDRAKGTVTFEGGTRLHAVGKPLAKAGLSLENQGDVDRQSIAGATATATHGTGASLQNLSARVIELRLVTGTGEVIDITPESDPDAYLAARVSLGALGVVASLTIQCVPLYTLHRHDAPRPLADTLERLEEHVDQNDHFEFFVFPYTETALTRTSRRSHENPQPPAAWKRRLPEYLVENLALSAVCRTGRRLPRVAPRLNRFITDQLSEAIVEDRAYRVYASQRLVHFTEMEYAIPRASAREAIEQVLQLVARRRLPILFPLEVRFSAADDAFLSTAHGRETCYIAVHQYAGMEFETYFRAVEAIMDGLGGRPHWGKRHYQTAATLGPRYPEWDRFQAVRQRLDPDRVFGNDYTRRVLG